MATAARCDVVGWHPKQLLKLAEVKCECGSRAGGGDTCCALTWGRGAATKLKGRIGALLPAAVCQRDQPGAGRREQRPELRRGTATRRHFRASLVAAVPVTVGSLATARKNISVAVQKRQIRSRQRCAGVVESAAVGFACGDCVLLNWLRSRTAWPGHSSRYIIKGHVVDG